MAKLDLNPTELEEVRKIIRDGNPEQLVKTAENVGQELVKLSLKANQIRNIFGTARQIKAQWGRDDNRRRELILLKPKLVYQSARMKEVAELARWLTSAIDTVVQGNNDDGEEYDRFLRFMEFFEAILAYHKAYGGSD